VGTTRTCLVQTTLGSFWLEGLYLDLSQSSIFESFKVNEFEQTAPHKNHAHNTNSKRQCVVNLKMGWGLKISIENARVFNQELCATIEVYPPYTENP